jgi:hypothetical protein
MECRKVKLTLSGETSMRAKIASRVRRFSWTVAPRQMAEDADSIRS